MMKYRFDLTKLIVRRLLCIVLAALSAVTPVWAYTPYGEITGEETWSGTVHLTGDIIIKGKLTILPGTRVECEPLYDHTMSGKHNSHIEITVDEGTVVNGVPKGAILIAEGTENNPIIFTSAGIVKKSGDWYGIRPYKSSNVTLEYCTIEYADYGVYVEEKSVILEKCKIINCTYGIKINYNTTSIIHCCTITDNQLSGIDSDTSSITLINSTILKNHTGLNLYSGSLILSNNIISCNTGYGILFNGEPIVDMIGNLISENKEGIFISLEIKKPLTLSQGNDIYNNTDYDIDNHSSRPMEIVGNYLGEYTTKELKEGKSNLTKIFDSRDDPSKGAVIITSWSETPFYNAEPVPTPTPTPNSQQPALTPTPTAQPAESPFWKTTYYADMKIYEFERPTLRENEWIEIPGGFLGKNPGSVECGQLPESAIPSSYDGDGLSITVNPDEVLFIHAINPITADRPILMRLAVRADSPNAAVALAALKGNLSIGENTDGSIATHIPATADSFIDDERRIVLVFQPDAGQAITPIIQVAATGNSDPATVWVDRLEIFYLDDSAFGNIPFPRDRVSINIQGLLKGVKPLEMVRIPAGNFMMGSPDSELDRDLDEGPQHLVTITRPFFMSIYEITQAQWLAVMGNNPSYWKGDDLPVEEVSWYDCQDFIQKLNQFGQGNFRLPAEEEWEYACRAGTSTRFYWGDDPDYSKINNYSWNATNSESITHIVGLKCPNPFGLFDMSGNVWEWCQDKYGEYDRVRRGGGWDSTGPDLRSAVREWNVPTGTGGRLGFRIVRDIDD